MGHESTMIHQGSTPDGHRRGHQVAWGLELWGVRRRVKVVYDGRSMRQGR